MLQNRPVNMLLTIVTVFFKSQGRVIGRGTFQLPSVRARASTGRCPLQRTSSPFTDALYISRPAIFQDLYCLDLERGQYYESKMFALSLDTVKSWRKTHSQSTVDRSVERTQMPLRV